MEKYHTQPFIRTCRKCEPFEKFGTLRLERKDEQICSVCGRDIIK